MSELNYQDGRLVFSGTDLAELMDSRLGQPCYVYSLASVKKRCERLKQGLSSLKSLRIHYAIKANANPSILNTMKDLGSGVDVVSGGELKYALANGFVGKDIIFSGVAKSVEEIDLAIDKKIKQINVESTQELIRIAQRGEQKGRAVPVALRMNPEVSPETHPYITTGMSENKFGMDRSFVPEIIRILKEGSQWLDFRGLTMHIGSQLTDLSAMGDALVKIKSLAHEFSVLGFPIRSLDLGGGVGIHYGSDDEAKDFALMDQYTQLISESFQDFNGEIMIEPGRMLVARSGLLLCQVEYIKETPHKTFVIVNTGMHHLMRPALYQAEHRIIPIRQAKGSDLRVCDVVGPICESSDFLAKNRPLPIISQGDFLAICDAGAYGYSMANNYNMHGLPDEVVIEL